jgi:hypothetical protein
MQTTFLTKYKPILGSGQQKKLEINNNALPSNLADEIEEKVVCHFDRVIEWSVAWFNEWIKRTGITLKVRCLDFRVRTWLIFIVDCYIWGRSVLRAVSKKVQWEGRTVFGLP